MVKRDTGRKRRSKRSGGEIAKETTGPEADNLPAVPTDAAQPPPLPEPTEEAGKLQRLAESLRSQLAAMTSDYEKLSRRSREERERTVLYANEALLSEVLPILDDFERALQFSEGPEMNCAETMQGVRLIHARLLKALQTRGLKPVSAVGQRFDPLCHEAVQVEGKEGVAPGVVLRELQRGYYYNDRLLRAARVAVTSGSAAPPPAEVEPADDAPEFSDLEFSEPGIVEPRTGDHDEIVIPLALEIADSEGQGKSASTQTEADGQTAADDGARKAAEDWLLDEDALNGSAGKEEFPDEKTSPDLSEDGEKK
jgi:molecular chaperone GrpE